MDENDRHVTVNGERYCAMLEDYLWPELNELDINDMWFQQDDATSHTARVTIDLLKGKFGFYFYGAISSHWSMPTSQQL